MSVDFSRSMPRRSRRPQNKAATSIRGNGRKFSAVQQQIEDALNLDLDGNDRSDPREKRTHKEDLMRGEDAAESGINSTLPSISFTSLVENVKDAAVTHGFEHGDRLVHNESVELEKDECKKVHSKVVETKPWAEVSRGNRLPKYGLAMKFSAPAIINGNVEIEIEKPDVQDAVDYWLNSIILFTAGQNLSMNAVKQFMLKVWNFISLPELYFHDDGYFVVRCKKAADRDEILANGPYTIFSMPIFLRKWSADFKLSNDLMRVLPVWVIFPRLPLYLWGQTSLSKIASGVGVPIVTDECTAKKIRISYARVLVEVDITQPQKKSVTIRDFDGTKRIQSVEYEWLPKFCETCQKIGHTCAPKEKQKEPADKGKGVWIPKPPQPLAEIAKPVASKTVEVKGLVLPKSSAKPGISNSKIECSELSAESKGVVETSKPQNGIASEKERRGSMESDKIEPSTRHESGVSCKVAAKSLVETPSIVAGKSVTMPGTVKSGKKEFGQVPPARNSEVAKKDHPGRSGIPLEGKAMENLMKKSPELSCFYDHIWLVGSLVC